MTKRTVKIGGEVFDMDLDKAGPLKMQHIDSQANIVAASRKAEADAKKARKLKAIEETVGSFGFLAADLLAAGLDVDSPLVQQFVADNKDASTEDAREAFQAMITQGTLDKKMSDLFNESQTIIRRKTRNNVRPGDEARLRAIRYEMEDTLPAVEV